MRRMRRTFLLVPFAALLWTPVLLTTVPEPGLAQSPSPETTGRKLERFRVAGGLGNYLGGLGVQGEVFVLDSRLSLVGGVGLMAGLHGAGAVRSYFVARHHHGGFLSVGVSPLIAQTNCYVGVEPDLTGSDDCGPATVARGPGVGAGYRYEMDEDFSVEGVIGAGWVEWVEPYRGIEKGDLYPLFALTPGYGL